MLSAKAAATIEADRAATSWGLVGSGLAIIGAALAVWIVTRVTSRQRERAGGIAALPARGATSGSPPTAATAPAT
jgi:Zn-dependent protease with chaperone function